MADAVRWLRGEFTTKTDARAALGVRTIVDDANVYDQLKLMARFVRLAGFAGLLVCFDEMVNLYKLANTAARNGNYEQILRIVNDCLQGSADRARLPVRRHPGLAHRHPPRPVQLRRAAQPAGREHLRDRRPGRLLRPGAAAGQPHPGRPLRAADQAAPRLRRRRPGPLPGARRGADRVHEPLRAADRRRLLPHPAHHDQGVPRPARRARAEPRRRLARHSSARSSWRPSRTRTSSRCPKTTRSRWRRHLLRPARGSDDELATFRL